MHAKEQQYLRVKQAIIIPNPNASGSYVMIHESNLHKRNIYNDPMPNRSSVLYMPNSD
jgi:hypothetical protein